MEITKQMEVTGLQTAVYLVVIWHTNHLMFLKHDFVSTAPRPGSGLTLSSHTEFGRYRDRGTGAFTGKKTRLQVYEVNINQTFDSENE